MTSIKHLLVNEKEIKLTDQFFYLTTPLYYVNANPHLGHAYTTILADVLARYHKFQGDSVFFLTGTDEHGQKMEQAARNHKKQPLEYCNELSLTFKNLWGKLNVEYDYFIRTTDENHRQIVQHVLRTLWNSGDIYQDEYNGWYCVPCERFWTEKDLVEESCPDCKREVQQITEKNYFFRMGRYQQWLIDHIEAHPRFIVPEYRRNEVLGFLRNPLNDLCISRPKSRLKWGIELPFDPGYVCYVWFDALINYITGAGYLSNPERFALTWPANYHLIGKDILTTHAVYWPIMLHAMGLEPSRSILAHGWWLVDNTKMSKSLGNVVKPIDLADKYGIDEFRFFLLREMSLGLDASFSEEALVDRLNSDLANDFGNLVNRLNKMAVNYLNGKLHRVENLESEAVVLMDGVQRLIERVPFLVEELKFHVLLDETMQVIRSINRYLELTAPWKIAKTGDHAALNCILSTAINALRIAAGILYPVMPHKILSAYQALGVACELEEMSLQKISSLEFPFSNWEIKLCDPLFPRIDKALLLPTPAIVQSPEESTVVTFDEFKLIDLRVVEILEAEPVAGTSKLLRLKVNAGEKVKQIIAGIALNYQSAELVGKKVVIVNNLQPARIKGELSEGMVLAVATPDGGLSLVRADKEVNPGEALH